VVHELLVHAPAATCYRVFVDEFASWWPPSHHIGDRTIVAFRIEGFPGGRCYDLDSEGGICQWGTVLVAEPPQRIVYAWHIQGNWTVDLDPARQSEVEVTFTPMGDDTTAVRLEHRHLDRHGAAGPEVQSAVASEGGWPYLLDRFHDVVEGRPARTRPD
jgi:uncharacterized protein YndB with AHSA1/START domain